MTDHEDLVAEIGQVEKMSTAERLKHAKKRRQHQLKKFSQYEKQLEKEMNKKNKNKNNANKRQKKASHNRRVVFVNNVMLLEAAARNDVVEVRNLLKRGVSADVTNEDGLTALHQCCIDDLEEMLRLLLEFRANVNAKDSELWTPLHAAATCGHIHLCRILIENGAELLSVNADGNMPYDICEDDVTLDFIEGEMAKRGVTQEEIDTTRLSSENKMLEDLKNLANNGEDLEFRGRVGETPLHIAAANGFVQVCEFLLKQRVGVDVEDSDSWQPIHAAACWSHLPILELLVQNGADIEAKTRNGESPFDICEDLEMKERMMEIKNEIETKGISKKGRPVRRSSTNTRSNTSSFSGSHASPRNTHNIGSVVSNSSTSLYNSNTSLVEKNQISASVRRTSMREKSAISWKEAMEEGRRFRESISSADGEDDEAEDEAPRKIDDVKMMFENNSAANEKKGSPREEKPKPKPGSSIREAENIWAPAAGTLPHQPKGDKHMAPQSINTKASAPPPPPSTSNKENKPPQNRDIPKAPANKEVSAPVLNEEASRIPTDNKENSSAAANRDNNKAPTATNRAAAPKPPTNNRRDASKPPPPQAVVRPTPQQRPREEPQPVISASKPAVQKTPSPVATRKQENKDSENLSDAISLDSTPSQSWQQQQHGAPSGTLSDLKKQRALALQEKLTNSLRFKDTDQLNDQVHSHNEDYSVAPPESNGAKKSLQYEQQTQEQNGKVKGNNNFYMPNTERNSAHKYKFTATTVVGDSDAQTSCCIIQ